MARDTGGANPQQEERDKKREKEAKQRKAREAHRAELKKKTIFAKDIDQARSVYRPKEDILGGYGLDMGSLQEEFGPEFASTLFGGAAPDRLSGIEGRTQQQQTVRESAEALRETEIRHETQRAQLASAGVQTDVDSLSSVNQLLKRNVQEGVKNAAETFSLGQRAAQHTQSLRDAEEANRKRAEKSQEYGLFGTILGAAVGSFAGPQGAMIGAQIGGGVGSYAGAKE